MTNEAVTLAGRHVPYTLTISHRARQPRLIVAPGTGLRVVAPLGYDRNRLLHFILRRQGWILKHLDHFAALPATPATDAPLPEQISFLGTVHSIRMVVIPDKRTAVACEEEAFAITVVEAALARPALEGWLRAAAGFAIAARVASRAKEMTLAYGRITIRDQKTRWGSCSRAGNLNFNWRLVLAPSAVLDYVVVHELAHRVELNHSVRFWRVVARYCPAYNEHCVWLRKHGAELRF